MQKNEIIKAENITKIYKSGKSNFVALNNINLSILEGEKVAIVGKSGGGKSTLMHLLAFLDSPSKGDVYFNGQKNIKNLPKLRAENIGFIFQQFYLNLADSAIDNVALPLLIQGVSKRSRKKLALKALENVGLKDKAYNKANDLSGGQKQRVAFARAIVNNPKVIFADEPTGNLDSKTGEVIENLLFEFNKNNNTTLVVVTHDEDFANKFDRQIHIKDGEII